MLLSVVLVVAAAGAYIIYKQAQVAEAAVSHIASSQGFCTNVSNAGNMSATCSAATSEAFSFTPTNTNDGVLFFLTCAANLATPSVVSLSASGWTFTQVGSITGSVSSGFVAVFRAYAPNSSAATITQSWTVSSGSCNNFMNDLTDEFSGMDTSNFVDASNSANLSGVPSVSLTPVSNNDMVWGAADDSIAAPSVNNSVCGTAGTIGANDTQQDMSEYRLLSGGGGSSCTVQFNGSGSFMIFAVAIKAATVPPKTVAVEGGKTRIAGARVQIGKRLPAFVQAADSGLTVFNLAAGTSTVAFLSNTTAGNTIIVTTGNVPSGSATTTSPVITDTQGNSYTLATSTLDGAYSHSQGWVFYATNIVGGADTVRAAFNTNPESVITVASEYAGVSTNNPIDVLHQNQPSCLTTLTTGNLTTTHANDLLYVAFTYSNNASAPSLASPWSLRTDNHGSSAADMLTADYYPGTTGTYSSSISGLDACSGGNVYIIGLNRS